MDITPVRFTPPTSLNTASATTPTVPVPQQRAEYVEAVKVDVNSDKSQQDSDNARLEAVERGARALKQVSPEIETFTIFKNNSGEYITRITNHTSGTVQYVPEQNILEYANGKEMFPGNSNVVQLNA